MRLLLDTHLLLWVSEDSERLPQSARKLLNNFDNEIYFSAASIWEISIKSGLNKNDFQIDSRALRRGLLENNFNELLLTSEHAVSIDLLPPIHKDLFDRILVAQSLVEGITLVTTDQIVARYSDSIRLVK